jgi:hypothetical protein
MLDDASSETDPRRNKAVEIAGDVCFHAAAGAQAYACTSSTWGNGKRADSVISAAVLHAKLRSTPQWLNW